MAVSESNIQRMCDLYKEGYTLEEVGQIFNLSRSRIRQLIRPRGITAKDGGAFVMRKKYCVRTDE